MAVLFMLLLGCFAYMALGKGTSKFLDWVISFATAAQMINWCVSNLASLPRVCIDPNLLDDY